VLAVSVIPPAAAETAPRTTPPSVALAEPLTREAIQELVARLSDQEVRALLLAQLEKAATLAAAPAGNPASTFDDVHAETNRLRDRVGALVLAAGTLPEVVPAALGQLVEGRSAYHPLLVALLFAIMLAVGWGVERAILWGVGRARRGLAEPVEASLGAQAGQLLLRLLLDILGLVGFAAGALAVFFALYQGHEPSRELVMAALGATLLVRLTSVVTCFLLAPRASAQRLLPFDDAAARRLHAGALRLAAAYAFGTATLALLREWGVPGDPLAALRWPLGILVAGLFLHPVWRNRMDIAALIRREGPVGEFACQDCGRTFRHLVRTGTGGPAEVRCPGCGSGRVRAFVCAAVGRLRRLLADLWPHLTTAYVLLVFAIWTLALVSGRPLRAGAGIASLLLVGLLPVVDMALCRALTALTRARGARAAAAESGGDFQRVLREGVHIVVTVGGLLLVARLWGIDLFTLTEKGIGQRLTRALFDVTMAGLLAYLAWQLVKTAIDRRLAKEAGPVGAVEPGEPGGTGASRLRTLLPLVRVTLLVTISLMAVMIGLSSLGVNIAPLLAGAGVVGLAIGFGAQTLVRDIVSGIFFLVDDAFRLGEYVDVGDVKGTVERISIRSMTLRHHRGPLNTVPYGMIRRLINSSRDWAIEKLEFRLTYDTDLMKVKKIFKRIGQELMDHPELGPNLLEPLKSQGVTSTEENALIVKAKFKSKPDTQFTIRREAYTRVLKAFEEAGIKFATREVKVFVPPGTSPSAAAGAAAAAAEPPTGRTPA
jgi:small-conductance mechanosensitive channel/DNA-directed RNA polymerase subunit RPC12/RpoP